MVVFKNTVLMYHGRASSEKSCKCSQTTEFIVNITYWIRIWNARLIASADNNELVWSLWPVKPPSIHSKQIKVMIAFAASAALARIKDIWATREWQVLWTQEFRTKPCNNNNIHDSLKVQDSVALPMSSEQPPMKICQQGLGSCQREGLLQFSVSKVCYFGCLNSQDLPAV